MADEWDKIANLQSPSVSLPVDDSWLQFADIESQQQIPQPTQQEPLSQYSWDTDPANPANMRESIAPAETVVLPAGQEPLSWGEVGSQALENIPASAGKFATDIGTALWNPLDTLGSVGDVALGAVFKAVPGAQPEEKLADKIGKFYSDRYGSMEGFKQALAKDPVGILGDFATVLTGGGAAVARAPGMAGRIGKVAAATGRAIDPLSLAAKPVALAGKGIGRGVSDVIGGLGTHTGGESLRQAAKAGFVGGRTGEAFQSGMRGTVAMQDVLGQAKSALQKMRSDRGAAYRSGMADLTQDRTILDFAKVQDIVSETKEIGAYKGLVKTPSTVKVVDEMASVVDEWGRQTPAEFHTPEGLDALKQRIGDIREGTDFGSAPRVAVDRVYNKVKDLIKDQAPEYAKIMKDYEEASTLTREIERAFSLGEKAMADTAMRKLQSLTRSNVNTNYGNRLALAHQLETAGGATEFLPALSGQALSSVTPRGLGSYVAGGTIAGGVSDPTLLALLPFQSPRLMGEAAYYGGKGGRLASKLANVPAIAAATGTGARMGARQAGRLQQLLEGEPPGRFQKLLQGY